MAVGSRDRVLSLRLGVGAALVLVTASAQIMFELLLTPPRECMSTLALQNRFRF